jgi:hypothetical protein
LKKDVYLTWFLKSIFYHPREKTFICIKMPFIVFLFKKISLYILFRRIGIHTLPSLKGRMPIQYKIDRIRQQ